MATSWTLGSQRSVPARLTICVLRTKEAARPACSGYSSLGTLNDQKRTGEDFLNLIFRHYSEILGCAVDEFRSDCKAGQPLCVRRRFQPF